LSMRKELARVMRSPDKRYAWVVRWHEGGKRKAGFHHTEEEARAEAAAVLKRLTIHGTAHEDFSTGERAAVLRWRELARELDIPPEVRLVDVVEEHARRYRAAMRSASLADAVEAHIERRRALGRKARTLSDLEHRLGRMVRDLGGERWVGTVTGEEIDRWLEGLNLSPVSVGNFRRAAQGLFNFAVKRGWCEKNPVADTDRPSVPYKVPGTITPAQLARLLAECQRRHEEEGGRWGEVLAVLALGAFCGLRTSEAVAMRWELASLAGGFVRVLNGKVENPRSRDATLTGTAAAWLAPLHKGEGRVFGVGERIFDRMRKELWEGLGLGEWPSNALRHSFASYRLAETKDAGRVSTELGNSVAVMLKRYKRLVTEGEARAWFNVLPGAKAGNVVAMTPRAARAR
jgi:integrase